MTPGPDPTRADKTAAWQGAEDNAHCTPRGSGSQSQDPGRATPSQVLGTPFLHSGGKGMRQPNSLCCPDAVGGAGTQQPSQEGKILTDSFQVVSSLHVGRAHLHKGVADFVQHLSEKKRVRSKEKEAPTGTARRR